MIITEIEIPKRLKHSVEIVTCALCGSKFPRAIKSCKTIHTMIVRSRNCKTCSTTCAKAYLYSSIRKADLARRKKKKMRNSHCHYHKTYTFRRYCIKCDAIFQPRGKFCKICDNCTRRNLALRSERYARLRELKKEILVVRTSKPQLPKRDVEKQ